ncbi:hypothetical protein O6H91_13G039300 [Diphasiastrum complanatum]|uniref:Uncharacterized protein n=1 Tax=Diphasiastrum complanatum TaxID=34168 RepID=A0ACC2BU20_DIPCM|nr:hypothetical protein O6H91_13G039300 [Diphasiastrum complanatum]
MMHRGLSQPPAAPALASTAATLFPLRKFTGLIGPLDRLRFYRKCFHDLDDQLLQLHTEVARANGSSGAATAAEVDATILQAEICCLEELIMLFTRLNSAISNVGSDAQAKSRLLFGGESSNLDYPLAGNNELDLSLVTDILMLSATSPWTLYVTERTQWQLCYVSPSVKRMLGWRPAELVGILSWDGCHPDDIPTMQRMLQLSDNGQLASGTTVVYRRMRKDRSYSTVQATGRAVGTRWYAWVEQDMSTFSANLQIPRTDAMDAETLANLRLRRQSNNVRVSQDRTEGRTWPTPINAILSSPTSAIHGFGERQQKAQRGKPNPVETVDPVEMTNFALEMSSMDIAGEETQAPIKGAAQGSSTESYPVGNGLRSEANGKAWRGCLAQDDTTNASAVMPSKQKMPNFSAQRENPSSQTWAGANMDELSLLMGKKVLLAEDDAVNRAIGKRLLESLKCEVTVACNGKEALDILQRNQPISPGSLLDGKEIPAQFDLVLMDLLMPVMDGTSVVEKFRDWEAEQVPPTEPIVIFAVTANVSDGDMVKCAQIGFDEFVSKPLTVDKLLDRLVKRTTKEKM